MGNEAHVRIDEGISRDQHRQTPAIRPIEGDSWTIPQNLDPDEILREYLISAQTSAIAVRYGIRRRALTRWLQQQRPKEWVEVQRIRALCTKEDGTEMIYDADTALQLARARELVKVAQFDLERLDPDYRPKQEMLVTEAISIEFTLGKEAGELLDQLRTVATQQIEHKPENET